MKIKPIFILGTARSGTTNLSNHIAQHSKIFGMLSKEHWGIKEHRLFKWQYYFGDLNSEESLFFFVENFSQSDFFSLSGITKDSLYKFHPKNIFDVFYVIINEVEMRNKYKYILFNNPHQTFYLEELIKIFPDAYFISIRRPVDQIVKSKIKMWGEKSLYQMANSVFNSQLDFGYLDKNINKINNILEIKFEDVINYPKEAYRKILNFLHLDWEDAILDNPYKINSSFGDLESKKSFFTNEDKMFVSFCDTLFNFIPYDIKKIFGLWLDKKSVKSSKFPDFKYRLHPCSTFMKGDKFNREDGTD